MQSGPLQFSSSYVFNTEHEHLLGITLFCSHHAWSLSLTHSVHSMPTSLSSLHLLGADKVTDMYV